ncbi:MAG: hypothetical protein MK042_10025 [Cognatishimia sp.]|nr:hypothetical protein [Cognatishimia sp.]
MSTAFEKYQRIEASALWRESPEAQRREVIISIGDASLLISDMQDRPLSHWSLTAVERANPGKTPAIFIPGGDDSESLELAENEVEMVEAIDTLRKALHRGKPHPGRLRWAILFGSVVALGAGLTLWLPNALRSHVVGLVPDLNRVVIGHDVIGHLERTTGSVCHSDLGDQALKKLAQAIGVSEILVVPGGIKSTASLPGTALVVGHSIVEDYEDSAAAIGFMLAEAKFAEENDPLERILEFGGVTESFRLLTSGQLAPDTLSAYAEHLAISPAGKATDTALIQGFSELGLSASPYAYALDISGETTLSLIEADAVITQSAPILTDGEWVALQDICAT